MSSTATAILEAIDANIEVRLRRCPEPFDGDVQVDLETWVGDRKLASRQMIHRDDLESIAGDEALAYTIARQTWAIRNAPTDNLEEPRR